MNTKSKKLLNTKTVVTLGVLSGLAVAMVLLVHFPILPAAPFLEYDPGAIPILIGTFAFGPVAGICITVVVALVQGFTVSFGIGGPYGIVMHIISSSTYVLVAGLIYKAGKTRKSAVWGLILGGLATVAIMIPANLIVAPIFMGVGTDVVAGMLFTAIVPFNLIKCAINGLVTFLVYKPISHLIQNARAGQKKQNERDAA